MNAMMTKNKERKVRRIKVGTYKFIRTKNGGYEKHSAFGGTNCWDDKIEEYGLSGTLFDVVLIAKTPKS